MRSRLTATFASATPVAGITGMHHHTRLIFVSLVDMEFHHVGQADLELLTLLSTHLASQSAEFASMSHHAWPVFIILKHGCGM